MGWIPTVEELAAAERKRIDSIDQNISSRSIVEKIKEMADVLDAAAIRPMWPPNPCSAVPLPKRARVCINDDRAILTAIRAAKEATANNQTFEILFTPE